LASELLSSESVKRVRSVRFVLPGVLLLAFALPARAQTENRFAIGGEVGVRVPGGPDAHGSETHGLLWRFGHGKEGFGFHWGLNWYTTDIDRSVAGRNVELGELRLRPFMAGYGYTHHVGAVAITGALLGGVAFTSFTLTPGASDVFRDELGARSISGDAGATLVARPEVSMWYDLSKKLGLHVSAGYMIARPHITVSSTLGDDRRRVSADMLQLKVGLAYAVWTQQDSPLQR
jgi:hypothetical protein